MKRHSVFIITLLLSCAAFINSVSAQIQNLQVTISGLKNTKGQVVLNVFKDNDTYLKEAPFKKITADKNQVANGAMSVTIPLEPGVYGITLIDDENKSGAMEHNLLKMPKEGFGFSNFFLTKMSRPTFNDFKINVAASGDNKAEIKVKYM